jgi:hypothetical protein
VGEPTNGWKTGRDPVQRALRVVTAALCLAVFVYLSVGDDPTSKLPTAGLALGACMVLLGYERFGRIDK